MVFCVFVAAGGVSEEIPALLEDSGSSVGRYWSCTWVKEFCRGCHGTKGQMLMR